LHNAGLPCLRTPLPWGQGGITRGLDHDCSIACNEGMPVVYVCAASKWKPSRCSATAGLSGQESGVRTTPSDTRGYSLSVRRSRAVINQHCDERFAVTIAGIHPHPSRQVGTPTPPACAEASVGRPRSPTLQSSGGGPPPVGSGPQGGAGRELWSHNFHARKRVLRRCWRPRVGDPRL